MSSLVIIDTADVVVKRKSDGHVFLTAEAQLTSISQTLGINEKIYGGIGNKGLFIMKGQKDVTATIRNAFYDGEFLAMTQGVSIEENGDVVVYKREDNLEVSDSLEVTIVGTPVGDEVYVRNPDGVVKSATIAGQVVTIPDGFAAAKDIVSVTYQEQTQGDVIEIESDKFGEAFEVEYHTIGYNPKTNKVEKDIYVQLDHIVPNGDFELSLENGTALAPEFTFDALVKPNTNQIGRIIEVPRVDGEQATP